ncbi:MAG: TIGR01777 family oxidoreductase [Acidobacteriaceae bacterium]
MEIFPQILISGATGLLGSALTQHFSSQGIPCASLVRHTPRPCAAALLWDPYHFVFREDMRRLSGIRAAVHLSGDNLSEGRWTAGKKRRIRESRIRSTDAMVALLSRLEQPPEVLICTSAVGYYGDCGDEILTENSSRGSGFLPDVCEEWETSAEAAAQFGIRVVSLRLGVVLAPGGGALARMLPVFRVGLGGNLGSGRQWMSWISLPEVVRIVEFCMAETQLRGPVNAVANPVTNREFTQTLARHLHRPALFPAPAFALRAAFGEMADAALLSSARAIPEKLLRAGFVFQQTTLPEAFQALLPS